MNSLIKLRRLTWQYYMVLALMAIGILLAGMSLGRSILRINHSGPDLPSPSLKALAEQHKLQLGNFALPKRYNERQYRHILTSQFHFALIDNQPNWHFSDHDLRPSRDSFDFRKIDEVVAFGQHHKMPLQAHHYIWGESKWLPDWLLNGGYSSEELLNIIKHHIHTVGSRYKGKIREWSVVNEAFSRNQHVFGLRDWWADNTGGLAYIDKAFTWAKEADPHSKLILNDFYNEAINPVSDAMFTYAKEARDRGVPIEGIGMQMHIDGTHPPTKDEVITNMKRFASLGLEVYVTEFDVNMNDLEAPPAVKDTVEARIYHEMLRACIESAVCKSFAYLGITDKESWYNYMGLEDARPLMFDAHYRPKPAYYSIREALLQPATQ